MAAFRTGADPWKDTTFSLSPESAHMIAGNGSYSASPSSSSSSSSGGGGGGGTTDPSPHHFPIEPIDYYLVGWYGLCVNSFLAAVVLWRIFVHHVAYRPYCACTSKRFFHWLIFWGRVASIPSFIGILTVGEFNLLQYFLHTLNNVFQSGALAVVVKEWAFVIGILRHHSHMAESDGAYVNRDDRRHSTANSANDSPLLVGRETKSYVSDKQGSNRSSVYATRGALADRSSTGIRLVDSSGGLHIRNHAACVKSVAIVYVIVFAVLCLGSFLTCAASYSLVSVAATSEFFSSSTHNIYISVETFWEAIINTVFLVYGITLRRSLIDNSPPRSQERVRKTLCRINLVVVIMASCSFLRLALHIRSLFSSKMDPQWITVLTYYCLYEWVGHGLPAIILLVLMRNPDVGQAESAGKSRQNEHSDGRRNKRDGRYARDRHGGGGIGNSPRSPESGRWSIRSGTPLWSSADEGVFSDWPSSYGSGGRSSNHDSEGGQLNTHSVPSPHIPASQDQLAQQQFLQTQQQYLERHLREHNRVY